MALRITEGAAARTLLRDLNAAEARVIRTREQLTSGSRIARPSDDPYATGRAISLRNALDANRQYRENVDEARGWAQATDAALGSLGDVVLRARELLLQSANAATGPAGRSAIAAELDQLVETAKTHASASFDGRYILSGTATTARPYVPGDDVYHGDAGTIAREVGPGVSVNVGQRGSRILGGDGTVPDNGLINVLRTVAQNLRTGTPAALAAVGSTELGRLDAVHSGLLTARAETGAVVNRLDAAADRLVQLEEAGTKLLSDVRDTDFARTIIDLNSQQAAYQAALNAGASIVQQSLLDFLR